MLPAETALVSRCQGTARLKSVGSRLRERSDDHVCHGHAKYVGTAPSSRDCASLTSKAREREYSAYHRFCHLIQNPPNPPGSAANTMDPTLSAWTYLKRHERPTPNWLTVDEYKAAKVSVLRGPAHWSVKDEGDGGYRYAPTPGYYGQDRATLREASRAG